MTSLNKPVSTIYLAVASAFVLAPPAQAETPTQLGAIDVQGAAEAAPYSATKAPGTKTDTPLMETPVSIQVVSRAVMDDQKATTIKEVLENVSGVRPAFPGGRPVI
jgi:iron complex outermembrane receptor protein